MKKLLSLFVLCLILCNFSVAQSVRGFVKERVGNDKELALPGASVHWINTQKGTLADSKGRFEISDIGVEDFRLIISYTGYLADTIAVSDNQEIESILKQTFTLQEVSVVYDRDSIKSMEARKTELISGIDLKKAACCNLGESFETNASVDITLKDAVSGSKEIQVLGLSGSYTQLLTENAPLIQGLGLTYGLYSIPGSQIENINIVKGPGSVIFGHESIAGMINVELKDPMKSDKLFLNGFFDSNLRMEVNADVTNRINPHLATLLSVHADQSNMKADRNDDSFLDAPLLESASVLNKWKYTNKHIISQNSIKALVEERYAGQLNFDFNKEVSDSSAYGQKLHTRRFEFYGRTGYIISSTKEQSIGLQYSYVLHSQEGFYGLHSYEGLQEMLDLRLIHNIEWNPKNSLNTGLNYRIHYSDEKLGYTKIFKNEEVVGAFIENTFQSKKKFTLITGFRIDIFQSEPIYSPRANIKYSLSKETDVRVSVGQGWKTIDILAENPNMAASNRTLIVSQTLAPEKATTYGVDITHRFTAMYRKGSITADAFLTDFANRIIPDYESDSTSNKVILRNLDGTSYSQNLMATVEYELIKNLRVKISYKYLHVFSASNGTQIDLPFIPKHRFFSNLFYETFNRKWTGNLTFQWYGVKRLPSTANNPDAYKMPNNSTSYYTVNIQINRVYKNLEIYIGSENLLNYRQPNPIISPANPYSGFFDTAYAWGPVEGRKIYGGIRFKIKH